MSPGQEGLAVREFADPVEFRRFADPLLLEAEARNNLILGVTGMLIDQPGVYPEHRLWAVARDGAPVLAAAVTPPYPLVVSDSNEPAALQALAQALAGVDLPGLQANEPIAEEAASAVARMQAKAAELELTQGVFELSEIDWPGDAPGQPTAATSEHVPLLVEWFAAFFEEADPGGTHRPPAEGVERRLDSDPRLGGIWIWEDGGRPVAMCGYGGPTPNGMRIGPVYTAPEQRGMGYASALVARQSAWLLETRRFCFLYTDLGNPTSNSIYRRIGYRQVAEAARYRFT